MSDMMVIGSGSVRGFISIIDAIKDINIDELIQSYVKKIFEGYEDYVRPIQNALVVQNIIKIYQIPVAISEIFKKRNFMSEADPEKRIDAGLDVLKNVRLITESTGAFFSALETFKAISIPTFIVKPFTAVVSILSIGSIITQYRTCAKIWKLRKLLNESKDFNEMVAWLKYYQVEEESFIAKTFNTNEEKLFGALSNIKGKEEMEKAAKGLKDRVRNSFVSSAVSFVASTIALIGTMILLVVTSATFGWLLLGVGIALDIEQFIFKKITEYEFSQSVDLKRSTWEWLTC